MPILNEQGDVVGYRGVNTDITEQSKAEILLAEKTERIMHHQNMLLKLANICEELDLDSILRMTTEQNAEILDVAQVGVWLFNPDGTEIVCRDSFNRNRKAHDRGASLKVQCYPRYFKALEENRIVAVNDTQHDLRTSEFAKDYLVPMGITSMLDVPIRLHKEIVGIICHEQIGPMRQWTAEDQDFAASVADMISLKLEAAEHKKAEEAIVKLNKDLEATIHELSRSNSQLQDFVHIAAHDLKTPLRGIGTLTDWLENDYGDKFDERGRKNIQLLKTRVIRIDNLIDGILRFSKITKNRKNESSTNLNALLARLTSEIQPPDNITIAVDSMPNIVCEPDHIASLFQILLSNAISFMDKSKGVIKVGCIEQDESWKFYVNDNGPGIERRYFEKIFRIFQTLPKYGEPQTPGIGLAIAKKIVELYGGRIWVESQPDSGSTFFFTLPKRQEEHIYAEAKTITSNR